MLENEFFQMQAYNAGPYPVVNLVGNQKFEQNTVFRPGRYFIEVAPGLDSYCYTNKGNSSQTSNIKFGYISREETITVPFIIRAYCGSDSTGPGAPGYNPYSGAFKVNGVDATNLSQVDGIDVNHIFGAGGGNGYNYWRLSFVPVPGGGTITHISTVYYGGGGNCLGNGSNYFYGIGQNSSSGTTTTIRSGGAGSCLHLLPVGGVFGTNYLRAYHINGLQTNGAFGSVFGGGATPRTYLNVSGTVHYWATRGGNSPYGTGGNNGVNGANGTGTGYGKVAEQSFGGGCSVAYYNGSSWINAGAYVNCIVNGQVPESAYIRVTYLGPLGS